MAEAARQLEGNEAFWDVHDYLYENQQTLKQGRIDTVAVAELSRSEKIELYSPFADRECLHCHQGARGYETLPKHVEARERLQNGELRCFSCHFLKHSVHELDKSSGL